MEWLCPTKGPFSGAGEPEAETQATTEGHCLLATQSHSAVHDLLRIGWW